MDGQMVDQDSPQPEDAWTTVTVRGVALDRGF